MARFAKKKKHSALLVVTVLLLLIAAGIMLLPRALFFFSDQPLPSDPAATEPASAIVQTTPETTQPTVPENTLPRAALEFPLLLDNGRIRIETPFPFDGLNPDCNFQEGTNIAGIVLHNLSADHLERVDLVLTTTAGSEILFHAEQIPAEKRVMLFAVDNSSLPDDESWADLQCEAVFAEGSLTEADGIRVAVDELNVTIKNESGKDIDHLVFYCHCPLGDEYFGGNVYQYEINDLSVNESVTVEAADCILGIIEVVRIDADRE